MASYTFMPEDQMRQDQDVRLFPSEGRQVQPQTQSTPLSNQADQRKQEFNILEKLKQLRDDKKYCDITLVVKGNNHEAHKNVLAAWSPYFESKLFPSDTAVYMDTVIVNYDNSEVFADLLDFMYNGYVAPRETNFLQLLHLAVSFQIETLKNYCEEFLRCNLHLGNFMSTYFLSRKYCLDGLEDFIVSFLQMSLSDAVKQSEFLSLTATKFNTFLSKGCMVQIKPEIKLFLIISWVGYDVQDRERYLVLLLGHIDWSSVASDFLLEISRTENFFTSHESSLYLLLQTLYSAGIPLGPYAGVFPTLRETHSHILTQVVHTSVLPAEIDDYYQVTITVVNRPEKRSISCSTTTSNYASVASVGVNTDVNNQHFTEQVTTDSTEVAETRVAETDTVVEDGATLQSEPVHEEFPEKTKRRRSLRQRKVKNNSGTEEPTVSKEVHDKPRESPRKTRTRRSAKETVENLDESHPETENLAVLKEDMVKSGIVYSNNETDSERAELGSVFTLAEDQQPDDEENIKEVMNLKEDGVEEEEDKDDDLDEESEEEDEDYKSENDSGDENESHERTIKKLKTAMSSKKQRKGSQKKYTCSQKDCNYRTCVPSRLDKHFTKMHQSRARLTCNICNFDTQVTRLFHQHMKDHFSGPPFSCDEAGCQFNSDRITKLVRHRLSHSGERPYGCEQCGMRFRSANNLSAHSKIHLGERPFECNVCKKTFALKNTLNQHMVTHSAHRPYLCDTCGFATKYQSHLIAHKRVHTGEVFHCQFPKCIYSTPKRSQLKSHMRSHLGIRSHVCQTCSKSFIERSHLVRHEKLHIEDKPFKCDECEYSTTRHDKLKEHHARHHGENCKKFQMPYKPRKSSKPNQIDITAPMLVKWDHGNYSLQQPNGGAAGAAGVQVNMGDQFCVIRDQLTTSQGLDTTVVGSETMAMDQRVISLSGAQMNVSQGSTMTELQPGMSTEMHHHGDHAVIQQVNNQDIVLDDGQQQLTMEVSNAVVSAATDTVTGETHTYTIIAPSTPTSISGLPQNTQQEYGGLGAFMALF